VDPGFETFAAGYWFAAVVALVAALASLAPARAGR